MAHLVALNAVWEMLEQCAPGFTRRASQHYWIVSYQGRSYRTLPLGAHGRRQNPDIETGHVRALIRHLQISRTCAEQYLDLT